MTDPQNSTQAAADLTEQEALTDSDIATLQEYLDIVEKIKRCGPPKLSVEFWNKIFAYINDEKKITSEYRDDVVVDSNEADPKQGTILMQALLGMIEQEVLSRNTEQEREVITALQTVKPNFYTIPNTALSNYLTNGDISKPFDLKVINKKGKQKEITNFTIVSYAPNSAMAKVVENMTEYERSIYNAICSIYIEATKNGQQPAFTIDMLYRAMPGSGDKASPQQTEAMIKTIEKHRFTHIDSDITEELRVKELISNDIEEVKLNDFILSLREVKVKMKNGGQQGNGYLIGTEPLLLYYGRITKNLITVSSKWLEVKKVKGGKATKEALLMTQERQAMTSYLIRRIKVMKNDKKNKNPTQSDIILFATLFDVIGLENPSRDKALNTRKSCYAILDYYKAEKIITDYEEQRKGRSVTGVKIIL